MINKQAIILFAFNRPDHFSRVLAGLKENNVNEIFIFVDGPRLGNEEDLKGIDKVKKLVESIDWCKVNYKFNDKNIGLANSVINGITEIFNKGYEKVIVIEEDCIPKTGFIQYMTEAFNFYDDVDDVMHISGFGLPIKKRDNFDTYINPYPCSWGWGTWNKYWEKCDFYNVNGYNELLNNSYEIKEFNKAGEGFSEFLQKQVMGKVDSWLIRWYYYIFKNNGKCVWVYESLIFNIGFDGSGKHKVGFDRFNQTNNNRTANKEIKFTKNLKFNEKIIKEFRRYFMGTKTLEKVKTLIYTIFCMMFRK